MIQSNICRSKFIECKDELNCGFKKLQEEHEAFAKDLEKRREACFQRMQKAARTGNLKAVRQENGCSESNDESDQENVPLTKRGRKKKTVLAENTEDNLQAKIKKEKLSMVSESDTISSIVSTSSVSAIKIERDDMPAPSWIPAKKKVKEVKTDRGSVRSTRTTGRKVARDSDVVVQDPTISTINLLDESKSEKSQPQQEKITRSTRTKTKKVQAEEDSGTETDNDSTRSTRTKTRNKKKEKNTESDEVEETRSTRTKTLRKGKKDAESEPEETPQEVRSTRTRTIKKGTKVQEESTDTSSNNNNKEDEVDDKKVDDESRNEPETRSARTKTIKKAPKMQEESTDASTNNKSEEEPLSEPRKPTKKVTEKMAKGVDATSNNKKANDGSKTKCLKPVPKPGNQGKGKRNRSSSTDEDANDKKRSRSITREIEVDTTAKTVYEDARSTVGAPLGKNQPPLLNSTYVTEVPPSSGSSNNRQMPPLNATITMEPTANSTVILDKPQFNLFDKKSIENMFTDDDSVEDKKTPPKKAPTKAGKEVFSPYEKTTLKKKVEAFEKLQNGSEIPRKLSANIRNRDTPSKVKEKAKMFTPLGSRFLPSSSSTSKISRILQTQNSSSTETLLGVKSAQKETQERHKKLLERDQAHKKKEAMLIAQTEAKRKLNEEKQLKAQQQRKLLEAEKLKQLEVQKQKDEKLKQREREREEYSQKQKLELEKKRAEDKKRIQEMQAQRQRKLEEQAKNPPIYLRTKLPRLPTTDCYDSDDADYQKTVPPEWCQREYARKKQIIMLAAGERIKNTLFCRHAQSPDLLEVFEVIDPTKLKRSSSNYWRTPPRYTMIPDLDKTMFEEDDKLYDSD